MYDFIVELYLKNCQIFKVVWKIVNLCTFSECQEALENMGIQFILEHFDTLFSFLIHFNNMEQKKQFNCWTLVSKGKLSCEKTGNAISLLYYNEWK